MSQLLLWVNGSPTNFFTIEKGLIQWDPLSLLLFNLCVNGLSCLLNQLLLGDNPSGFRIGDRVLLNHLQFAEDTLIFCEKSCEQVEKIGAILKIFLAILGLKLNYSKSSLIGCNVEAEKVGVLVGLLDVWGGKSANCLSWCPPWGKSQKKELLDSGGGENEGRAQLLELKIPIS